jgi:hypothetical protein
MAHQVQATLPAAQLEQLSSVRRQFANLQPVQPYRSAPMRSNRMDEPAGVFLENVSGRSSPAATRPGANAG